MGIIYDCATGQTITVADEPVPEDRMWSDVRAERNALLAACDWTQLPDAPVDASAWAAYRQALRDITTQPDPFNITWPEEPAT